MYARPAVTQRAVVKLEVAQQLVCGDTVVIQAKHEKTSDRVVSNYIGRIEAVIWKNAQVERLIVRVPREHTLSRYENTLAFVVVKEYSDDWQQRLLRRKR